MHFLYTKTEPVWHNEAYFSAVLNARDLRDQGQDRDLYTDRKLYRTQTRDCDTAEQFAYKCQDLIDYNQNRKVVDWEHDVLAWLEKRKFTPQKDTEASEIYWAIKHLGHAWGSDSYSMAVHGVHTAWLDLATKYKLDIGFVKAQSFDRLFETGD